MRDVKGFSKAQIYRYIYFLTNHATVWHHMQIYDREFSAEYEEGGSEEFRMWLTIKHLLLLLLHINTRWFRSRESACLVFCCCRVFWWVFFLNIYGNKMLHDFRHGIVNLLRAIHRLKTYLLFYTLKNDFSPISALHKTRTY